MSLAPREALNNLISNADVAQFATHAEDWSTCSSTAVLAALQKFSLQDGL